MDKLEEIFGTEAYNEHLKKFKLDHGLNEEDRLNAELMIEFGKYMSKFKVFNIKAYK